ncbi:MAG: histidinol-phosphatase HisJ family protein [Bacteroidales bacterium]|nr:histidinol-phosphatase HisJ family protein [Bacteroidales bacterium]
MDKLFSNVVDTHSHSNFSPDSRTPIEAMVEAAASQGLAGIAITDHLDLKTPDGDTSFTFDIAKQQQEIDSYINSDNLLSQFKIFKGIEIGLQPHNLEDIKEYIKGFDFDTVIASIHFVDGVDPYSGGYYQGLSEKEAYGRYLELFYEMIIAYPDFDILGHYDYIARYSPYANRTLFYKDYSDIFDSLFKYLIYNGKALEINSNTYRTRDGKTPALDLNILKRYLDLGGEFVTIGSDAHTPERFGEQFYYYLNMVYNCGFKYITHYNQRKPIPLKIELS